MPATRKPKPKAKPAPKPLTHTHPIRAAVFDIDGTLALMDKDAGTYAALPGAVETVAALARKMPVIAYTNGTFFPPEHYYPLLAEAGFAFAPGHILTPAVVAARQLKKLGHIRVMVLGADGARVPLRQAGMEIVEAAKGAPKVDAVLVAWTPDFNAANLEAAAQAVWAGAPLYATSVAPYFAGAKGRLLGVSGAIAAAIHNATGVKAILFGKPDTAGLDMAAEIAGVAPHEMVVIGDDPKLELEMARRGGAFAVGVTTGVAEHAAFAAYLEEFRAHVVLEGLTGLAEAGWWKGRVEDRDAQTQ